MTRRRKRIESVKARPPQMRFSELETILIEDFDFVDRTRGGGSHHKYKSPTYGQVHIPRDKGRWVKGVYLDEICRLLGIDDIDLDTFD